MQPKYEVPLVLHNLRRDETIVEIATSLNHLSKVSNNIFDRINKRIQLNKEKIKNISDRIDIASSNVAKLAGAKKATQVFSSSKYPGTDVNRAYKSIFIDKEGVLPIDRYKHEYKSFQSGEESLDTLQFYHVKIPVVRSETKLDGLGEIPVDVENVNDLLLYNTGRNVYDNYVISNTHYMKETLKKEEVKKISEVGAAPASITDRASTIKNTGASYFYSPHLGNVPSIDVPLDLPDLPGIADNLRYIDETGPGIAPSVTTTPNVPELPDIIEPVIVKHELGSDREGLVQREIDLVDTPLVKKNTEAITEVKSVETSRHDASRQEESRQETSRQERSKQEASTQETSRQESSRQEVSRQEPYKQETSRSEALEEASKEIAVGISKEAKYSSDEISPGTAKQESEYKTSSLVDKSVKSQKVEPVPDLRSNLMEAIRQAAGGKKLRSVAIDDKETNNSGQSSGDLMADLHAKLSMRRKGISGARNLNPGSGMDKISAMIPPPPIDNQNNESAEDGEWDD